MSFFDKIQNPKESEHGFCASLLNWSIQDLSDHSASKESLTQNDWWDVGFLCSAKKRKIRFRIHSGWRSQSWIFLWKRTLQLKNSSHVQRLVRIDKCLYTCRTEVISLKGHKTFALVPFIPKLQSSILSRSSGPLAMVTYKEENGA